MKALGLSLSGQSPNFSYFLQYTQFFSFFSFAITEKEIDNNDAIKKIMKKL